MANYAYDRSFTDFVHQQLALPQIYTLLHWTPYAVPPLKAQEIDIYKGIDYVFTHQAQIITVQERFRESQYQKYNDFTIRYRRDNNPHADRKASEFYKIKAKYFTYGIVDGTKATMQDCKQFIKYAVIDLEKVYVKIDEGSIIIADNKEHFCKIVDGKMICPVKYNTDGSSSFFPIDIAMLAKLWGNGLLIAQKGYL